MRSASFKVYGARTQSTRIDFQPGTVSHAVQVMTSATLWSHGNTTSLIECARHRVAAALHRLRQPRAERTKVLLLSGFGSIFNSH